MQEVLQNRTILDAIVEDYPRRWGHRHRGIRTVRRALADRGHHGRLRPAWDRAWVQQGRVGKGVYEDRVWWRGRPRWSFPYFHDAVVVQEPINCGVPVDQAWPDSSFATKYTVP